MMSHTYTLCPQVLAQRLKIAVTEFARSHLNAHLVDFGIRTGVEMNTVKKYAPLVAKSLDKSLVAVGLLATKLEVTMHSLDAIAQLLKDQQQRHTVGTTAECYKVQALVGQKPLLRDEIGNFTQHRAPVLSGIHPQDDKY